MHDHQESGVTEFIIQRVRLDPVERSRAIGRVVEALEALDHSKKYCVRVDQYKHERSESQNGYLWGCPYKILAEHTGFEAEELHAYFCGQIFGWKDKRVPKTPRNPSGIESVPVRTTTRNEHGERDVMRWDAFSDFWSYIQRFAAQKLNVHIPDPDPQWKDHRERKAA